MTRGEVGVQGCGVTCKEGAESVLLRLTWDARGLFKERPNKFLGVVDIWDPEEMRGVEVHMYDPGRLGEILFPGNPVLLKRAQGKHRRTAWDLIAGRVSGFWIPVHSGYHRALAEGIFRYERLSPFGPVTRVRPEVKLGHSRMDFLLEKRDGSTVWVEVKGCTLARDGVALFPDAPTKRGQRHIEELIKLKESGEDAALLMLVFRPDARYFAPNMETDPLFSSSFYRALKEGVEVHPLLLSYDGRVVYYERELPVVGEKVY